MAWLYIWLGIVVVALIVEFLTMDLVSIWFSLGAFVAMILAGCKVSFEIQIIVAVIISLVSILSLRKVTLKFLNRNKEKTNLDLIIGKKVKLLSAITKDNAGTIKHNGIVYTAITETGSEIEEGKYVIVEKLEGNKFIVKEDK